MYFENHQQNSAFRYLQRIDFFKTVGLNPPENFKRNSDSPDFIPIREISSEIKDVSPIATRMAKCVAPSSSKGSGVFQLVEYAAGEAMLNCKQHSNGRGFVAAQYAAKRDLARTAVGDSGIGVLASFRDKASLTISREWMTYLP